MLERNREKGHSQKPLSSEASYLDAGERDGRDLTMGGQDSKTSCRSLINLNVFDYFPFLPTFTQSTLNF